MANKLPEDKKKEIFDHWINTGATYPELQKIYACSFTSISNIISEGMNWKDINSKAAPFKKAHPTPADKIKKETVLNPGSIYSRIGGNVANKKIQKTETGLPKAPSLHNLKMSIFKSKFDRKR